MTMKRWLFLLLVLGGIFPAMVVLDVRAHRRSEPTTDAVVVAHDGKHMHCEERCDRYLAVPHGVDGGPCAFEVMEEPDAGPGPWYFNSLAFCSSGFRCLSIRGEVENRPDGGIKVSAHLDPGLELDMDDLTKRALIDEALRGPH